MNGKVDIEKENELNSVKEKENPYNCIFILESLLFNEYVPTVRVLHYYIITDCYLPLKKKI